MATDPFCIIFFMCQKQTTTWMNALQGYMAVSDVGRIAIGSSRSEFPLFSR